ncbi:MAG: putative membrane protein [Chitinophagales bacterium]|jgi:uncharacterized membrane protein
MRILKDIEELLENKVITEETASGIRTFYQGKKEGSQNRLFAIFGILGALLVGLGVVLIIAHNWDNMSRGIQTLLAFLPLLIAQGLVVYSMWQKPNELAWVEGSAILLFFAIGACISMISQIYHVTGNIGDYLFTWMILALPIVYLLPSSIVAIFYLLGITYMGLETGYFNTHSYTVFNKYWLMLLALLPYYFFLQKNRNSSNFLNFFNWLIPISVVMCLGMFADHNVEWLLLAYMSLFGILYGLGRMDHWFEQSYNSNGFKFLGSLGMVAILLISSFRAFWKEFKLNDNAFSSEEFYIFIVLTILAIIINAYSSYQTKKWNPKQWLFLLFIPLFFMGLQGDLVVILMNVLVLAIGVQTIREGAYKEHLGHLNYGLLIIAALVACRFFDSNLSFVFRGLLFILVGLGFFFVNYWMINRRKSDV